MQRRPFCFLLSALLLPSSLSAGANLCREKEDPIFDCSLQNKKIVDVCALYDPSGNQYRALTYRYGTPDHIEISLPEDPNQFRKIATADESVKDKAGEDDQFIRFANRQFSYVVYAAIGKGFRFEGLAVFDGQKMLSNTHCTSSNPDLNIGLQTLLHIGVPEEEESKARLFWNRILPASSALRTHKALGSPGSQ